MPKILDRRNFILSTAGFAAGLAIIPSGMKGVKPALQNNLIRLGAPVPGNFKDPAEWAKSVKSHGYSAAYCPVNIGADRETIRAFRDEASKNDIKIAEVVVWNNMLDPDNEKQRQQWKKMLLR